MRFAPCQLCLHFVRRNQRYRIIDVKNRLTQHYIRSLLNHCSASPSKINSFIYPRLEDFSHVHANSRSNRAEAGSPFEEIRVSRSRISKFSVGERWNLSRMFIQFSSEPCRRRRMRPRAFVATGPSLPGLIRFSFDPAGSKCLPHHKGK